MVKKKGKRHITVEHPVFIVTFEGDKDIFFKTNSIMKALEFFENGEIITMEAIDSKGEQISTDRLERFTIAFKTGSWKVATSDTVYRIISK